VKDHSALTRVKFWTISSPGRVFLEGGLVPDDAGILVGVAVVEPLGGAGLAPVDTVELDLVLGALADGMAGDALLERLLITRLPLRACP